MNKSTFSECKSPRAFFHNYTGGDYFVTICTSDKVHYFGEIYDGNMNFSPLGSFCQLQLEELHKHYAYAEVLTFVVMPNHIHAIIRINSERTDFRTHEPCVPTLRSGLSVVIGGLKRAVTMWARRNDFEFAWQKRFHDHIIRGIRDGNNIAEYIENNISRWDADCYYSEAPLIKKRFK